MVFMYSSLICILPEKRTEEQKEQKGKKEEQKGKVDQKVNNKRTTT